MKTNATTLLFTAAMILSTFSFAPAAKAAPGDLDLTFGGTGKVIASFGGLQGRAYASAVQADGKLVLAGSRSSSFFSGSQFLIARFGTNNLLDPTFGFGGKVVTPVTTNNNVAQAVAVQADGKIIAAGYAYQESTNSDFALVRYNPDGSPDTTFGTNGNGIVFTDPGQYAQITAIAIQADGKIVVDGFIGSPGVNNAGIALARYQTNGALDLNFGTGGIIAVPGGEYDALYGLMIQSDQKIVAVGSSGGAAFAIYRFTTNGTPDSSFGGGTGRVLTSVGTNNRLEQYHTVATQAGGVTVGDPDKIVAAGFYTDFSVFPWNTYQTLIRYNIDGTLDSSFGHSGIVTNLIGNGISQPVGVMVQGFFSQPRKITVGGSYSDGTSNYFAVNRYTDTGILDTTFGTGNSGKTVLAIGPATGNADAAATAMSTPAGTFIVSGYAGATESGYDFASVRFNSSGLVDTSFGTNGLLLSDVADGASQARAAAIQTDGKIVVVGHNSFLTNNSQNDRFALARFNPDGSADTSFGTGGKTTLSFGPSASDDANAVALQPDGKIIAAGSDSSGGFALARFNPNGSLDTSFGTNGMTTAQIGGGGAQISAIRLQSDGKILAGGYVNSGSSSFALARFTSNGILDTNFGSGGSVLTTFTAPLDLAFGIGTQPDGKIALAGTAISINGTTYTADFAVARYNTNGALDFSFGSLGRATGNVGGGTLDIGYAMAMQPDGKIVVAGAASLGTFAGPAAGNPSVNSFLALMRFNTNGTPDNSFGAGGSVITQVGAFSDFATSVALQTDGKILVTGASQSGFYKFFALRYTSNGVVDGSYGNGGTTLVDFGTSTNEVAYGLSLDSFGRAILSGDAGGAFAVARLQGDALAGPLLKIFLTSTNTAVIKWPYPSTGWNLRENTNLNAANWTTPSQNISNDGTNNFIVVSPPALTHFYRLQNP